MATALTAPPPRADFARLALRIREVDAKRLVRVSRHGSGEPFFGRAAANRFDDPARRFGTCYAGFDPVTAVAETVLHDEVAVRGRFAVARGDFEARLLVRFADGATLRLADLSGVALKTLGADGSISTILPYDLPQQWAAAVHAHPAGVDGIRYVSRHLNTRKAVVIFDRAAARLGPASCEALGAWPGLARLRKTLHIDYAVP